MFDAKSTMPRDLPCWARTSAGTKPRRLVGPKPLSSQLEPKRQAPLISRDEKNQRKICESHQDQAPNTRAPQDQGCVIRRRNEHRPVKQSRVPDKSRHLLCRLTSCSTKPRGYVLRGATATRHATTPMCYSRRDRKNERRAACLNQEHTRNKPEGQSNTTSNKPQQTSHGQKRQTGVGPTNTIR